MRAPCLLLCMCPCMGKCQNGCLTPARRATTNHHVWWILEDPMLPNMFLVGHLWRKWLWFCSMATPRIGKISATSYIFGSHFTGLHGCHKTNVVLPDHHEWKVEPQEAPIRRNSRSTVKLRHWTLPRRLGGMIDADDVADVVHGDNDGDHDHDHDDVDNAADAAGDDGDDDDDDDHACMHACMHACIWGCIWWCIDDAYHGAYDGAGCMMHDAWWCMVLLVVVMAATVSTAVSRSVSESNPVPLTSIHHMSCRFAEAIRCPNKKMDKKTPQACFQFQESNQ